MPRARMQAIILCAVVFTACQTSTEIEQAKADLEFSTSRSEYSVGDTVEVRLVNGSRFSILYNLCFTGIEAFVEGNWTLAGPFGRGVCAAVSDRLEVGESATSSAVLSELTPGRHRLVTGVEVGGSGREEQLTTEFVVR